MLEHVEETFADERIGPRAAGAPQILIGGHADASFAAQRPATADGWIAGGTAARAVRRGGGEGEAGLGRRRPRGRAAARWRSPTSRSASDAEEDAGAT